MQRGLRVIAIVVAVLASIFVGGVGHAWLGRWRRGLVWVVLCLVAGLATVLWLPFFWLAVALRVAHVIDLRFIDIVERPWEERALTMAAFIAGGVALSFGIRHYAVEAHKIPSSGMAPTLAIGDHVFADKTGLEPTARGDVITFRNPCTPTTFVKRVVALGGDTVEVRCTVLYVNGEAQPRELVRAADVFADYEPGFGRWSEVPASRWRERIGTASAEIFLDAGALGEKEDERDFPLGDRAPICPAEGGHEELGEVVGTPDPDHPCAPQVHYVVPAGHVFVMGDNRQNSADSRSWGPVPVGNVLGRVIGIWWSRDTSRIGAI